MPADEATAREDLAHLLPIFYGSVVSGVRAYYAEYSAVAHRHRTMTRRCITRDEIVYDLRGPLDGLDGVRIVDRNQTTYIHVGDASGDRHRILVKKSDDDAAVELGKTQASFDFQGNSTGDLFGVELTNLYLSYVPDPNEPDHPTVLLICPNSGGYDWVMELQPPAVEIAGEITGAPMSPDHGDDLVRIPAIDKPVEFE